VLPCAVSLVGTASQTHRDDPWVRDEGPKDFERRGLSTVFLHSRFTSSVELVFEVTCRIVELSRPGRSILIDSGLLGRRIKNLDVIKT
jgi:hypothetical protein